MVSISSPGSTGRMLGLIVLLLLLTGCNHYFERRDTASFQAGDAGAWNRAIHTVDPWPVASRDTTIPVSGRRVVTAIEAYENHGAAQPGGLASPNLSPVAPMSPGAAP
jgi:hypothetical protein